MHEVIPGGSLWHMNMHTQITYKSHIHHTQFTHTTQIDHTQITHKSHTNHTYITYRSHRSHTNHTHNTHTHTHTHTHISLPIHALLSLAPSGAGHYSVNTGCWDLRLPHNLYCICRTHLSLFPSRCLSQISPSTSTGVVCRFTLQRNYVACV